MLSNRKETLMSLVELSDDLNSIKEKLSRLTWDFDFDLVTISATDISKILTRYIHNELTSDDVENWANLIECREDIGFTDDSVKEIVFDLANPVLYGELTKNKALNMIKKRYLDQKSIL